MPLLVLLLACRQPAETGVPETDEPADTDTAAPIDTDVPADTDETDHTDAPDSDVDTDVVVLGVGDFVHGTLVVTEVQRSPTKVDPADGQWIEIHNAAAVHVDLFGLEVAGGRSFTIGQHVVVEPGGYAVLGNHLGPDVNGGVALDYADVTWLGDWAGLELRAGEALVDAIGLERDYTPGAATQLDPGSLDATSNDREERWCDAVTPYGAGDLGTPGSANAPCPADADKDGFLAPEDCDDADADVHPGAVEVHYDGVDQDCDGSSDYDRDRDGFDHDGYGGDDCDDDDPGVRPDAVDLPGDGLDQDCDGADATGDPILGLADLAPGDLVITEVMRTPDLASWDDGQWIEVHNAASEAVWLDGLVVECVGVDRFTVRTSIVVEPGDVFVLGGSDDPLLNGGVAVDLAYTAFAWPDEPQLLLHDGGTTIYDGLGISGEFPYTRGASLNLDPAATDAASNDAAASWCDPTSTFGTGDLGTPGAANDPC